MKCAYCGNETKGTKEHIISRSVLSLFPECDITIDESRARAYNGEPVIKDVCAECNNNRISYIDRYAQEFIRRYFVRKYTEDDIVEIEYDYVLIQKMLLKYAFNDMRLHKYDCSFYDDDILHYLINESDASPKSNISILCGLAVNVSPIPDYFFGNIKLNWCKDPLFYSNSSVLKDHKTGEWIVNDNMATECFADLSFSYLFKFNSVQFLLMCWEKESEKIQQNNNLLQIQYPYALMSSDQTRLRLPVCTNEHNYHHVGHIHIRGDGCFEMGRLRKLSFWGKYEFKEIQEKKWEKVEESIRKEHARR